MNKHAGLIKRLEHVAVHGVNVSLRDLARQSADALQAESEAVPVWIVATGEITNGMEQYTRHDVRPPLCDAEKLYTQQASAKPLPLTNSEIKQAGDEIGITNSIGLWETFELGVKFAEKHHNIKEPTK